MAGKACLPAILLVYFRHKQGETLSTFCTVFNPARAVFRFASA